MTAILNVLLEITIYSAMLYGAILLFKRIFHKHISAVINYAVWALLIIRLIMPITIDSGFSLFKIPEPAPPVVYPVDRTIAPPAAPNSDSSVMPQTALQHTASFEIENTNTNAIHQPGPVPSVYTKIDWQTALGLLWALGVLVCMAYAAALGKRLNRQIRLRSREVPPYIIELIEAAKQDLGIKDKIQVTMHGWLNSPALSVALRPRLLLPAGMLEMDCQQIELGIRHELTHYRRKDHLTTLLLVALRCVYWFNPIVWLAFPQIQTDMETLCDVSVTERLEKTERLRYINTMVELSCRPKGGYILGMGMHNGRRALEKRVKGMFMKRKTKISVRMGAAIAAGIMLMTCFTTACQPTPEKGIVVNKGDGKLQEKIYNEGETSGPYEAPATWQDELVEGELNLFIDADIETPNTNGLPVALIEPDEITDGDAASLINALTAGNPVFALQTQITKDILEAEILEIKQVINDPDSDFNTVTKKDNPERYELRLKELQERLELLTEQHKDAPENQSKSEIELRFIPETEINPRLAELNDPPDGLGIAGYTEKDGGRYQQISFNKPAAAPYYDQYISYYRLDFGQIDSLFTSTTTSNLRNCKLTLDEACNMAEEFLNKLDIQDMGLSLAASAVQYNPEYDEGKEIINEFSQSYVLYYTRKVNGVQITHQLNQPDPAQQYDAYWPQELIVMAVNDSGVTQFSWVSPISVKSIINSHVELLHFSEIQEIFRKNIGMNIDYSDNDPNITGREIHINRVVLGLTKIKQKDSREHILVPSWNFFGYEINKYDGPQPGGYILDENHTYTQEAVGQSFLTINAVDGSLINTDVGY